MRSSWLILLAWGLGACEEQVNPLVGEEQPFSVYGYLNPKSNTQLIRVIPVVGTIDGLNQESIDASVLSIDLETGEQRAWEDSLVTFATEETGHLFVAHFRPAYGRSYRVEVIRSDGVVSSAEVTVPPDVTVEARIGNTPPVLLPFFVAGQEKPNIVQADMEYQAAALQPLASGLNPIFLPVSISYRGMDRQVAGGWEVIVDLRRDFAAIKEEFDRNCLTIEYIAVRKMEFVIFIGDASWVPPGGVFDEEVLVQPDLFSNVENGFGFVGAGFPLRFNVIQPGNVLQSVGFAAGAPCDPALTPPTDPSCRVIPPCLQE